MKHIAIFASGNGTNAEKIFQEFQNDQEIEVSLVLTNNPSAGVISKAERYAIPVEVFNRKRFYETTEIVDTLKDKDISLVVLAGFLWLLPISLINAFPDQIINIHPALLPKYGGKGMYGMKVHEAVLNAQERESGITIHYINENYDEGKIIFQQKCDISKTDTAEDIAKKVQQLEHLHYPEVIRHIFRK